MAIFKKNSNGSTTTLVDYVKLAQDEEIEFKKNASYQEPNSGDLLHIIVGKLVAGITMLSKFQKYDNLYLSNKQLLSDALAIDDVNAISELHSIQKVKFGQTVNLPQAASNYREFAGIREVFVIEPGYSYLLRFTFPPFRSKGAGVDIPGTMFFIHYNAGKWSDWEQVSFTSFVK